jgi:hypothetical protein
VLLLGFGGCSRQSPDGVERATREVSAAHIDAHGRRLASDAMGGRYYASPEADTAAAYIVARLRAAHIAPVSRAEALLGPRPASFTHPFSITLYGIGAGTRLGIVRGEDEHPAELGSDYMPLVFAAAGSVEGPVVRLEAPLELALARSALTGRIAVVTSDAWAPEPGENLDAALFRVARRIETKGAAAVLFAGPPSLLHTPAATYPNALTPEQRAAITSSRGAAANLQPDRLSLAAQAQAWRDAGGRTLPALVVRSSWLDRLHADDRVRLRIHLVPEVSLAQNVLVGFRGRSRPDELVVVGANYDHAGINAAGDVLNGADDNASGVAALIEIAAALGRVSDSLQRSVLVVFFSGARQGLQGSEMLLHDLPQLLGVDPHPVAMLALRGLGRNGSEPMRLVGGRVHPALAEVFERCDTRAALYGAPLGLRRTDDETTSLARLEIVPSHGSEHLSFARNGVPSVLLTDDLDAMLYGQPEDDWREVDPDKVMRAARLVFRASYLLATDLRPGTTAALAHTD